MRRSLHPGAWLVLAVLAAACIHTLPLRHRFFSHLHSPFPPVLVQAYVALLPVVACGVYILLAPAAWNPSRPWKWSLPRPKWRGVLALAAAYALVAGLDYGLFALLFPGTRPPGSILSDFAEVYPACLGVGFFSAMVEGLELRREHALRRAKEAEGALAEAKGRLVSAQLDPHVVFNVLGTVEALLQDERASGILEAMGAYLRGILDVAKARLFPLGREQELIQQYLNVQAALIGPRLMVEWDWDPAIDGIAVPPLLLQTLVENAVKHGISPSPAGGMVRVTGRLQGDRLALSVANSGLPPEGSRRGTGLRLLEDRLFYQYGMQAEFSFQRRGQWTLAEISIPRSLCA